MFDRRLLQNFDWPMLYASLAICLIGVASIYSASRGYAGESNFWLKQLMWIGAGLMVGFVLLLFDFRAVGRFAYLVHAAVIVLLLLMLIHPALDSGGQTSRWIRLGSITVQPSEFAKFSTIWAIAYYFRDSRRVGNLGVWGILFPTLLVVVPFVLIMRQPDLGTAILLLMIYFPMVVLAGLRERVIRYLIVLGFIGIGLLILAFQFGYYKMDREAILGLKEDQAPREIILKAQELTNRRFITLNGVLTEVLGEDYVADSPLAKALEERTYRPLISLALRPYQQKRIVTFVDPTKDPLGSGYHVIQSKIAVGSGRFFGKGYGDSTQGALNFLPARHTDFLFAIFAEEWGFLGAAVLVGLFVFLIQRTSAVVLQTRDRFSAFLVMGFTANLAAQVLVNLGMVTGLLPVVGVPLPFFSYGGSSMVTMLIGLALVLNIRMRRFLWS